MKRLVVLLSAILFVFSGCQGIRIPSTTRQYQSTSPVGTVPEEFCRIIDENLFHSAVAYSDRVLKYDIAEDGYTVKMYDLYGKLLASYNAAVDDSHAIRPQCLTATSNGGFLFVLGFSDYAKGDGIWASHSGVSSQIIQCDAQGQLLWSLPLENYTAQTLQYCIEQNGNYYFFGDIETPATDTVGVVSPSDIHMAKISTDGKLLQTKLLAGSDYDNLSYAKADNGNFTVFMYTQSSDGDFTVPGTYKLTIDESLTLLAQEEADFDIHEYLGTIHGKVISSTDDAVAGFPDGRLTAVLDYGDFYLTVSENITGEYEHTPPYISSTWYYTETVYAAYDQDGSCLWKQAVDSSPDWDAIAESMQE